MARRYLSDGCGWWCRPPTSWQQLVRYAERAADLHQLAARTTTSLPGAIAASISSTAAALLLTIQASSAGRSRLQQIRYRPIAMAAPGTVQNRTPASPPPHHRAYRVLHRLRQQAPRVGVQHGAAEVEHRQSRALLPGQLRPQRLRGRRTRRVNVAV